MRQARPRYRDPDGIVHINHRIAPHVGAMLCEIGDSATYRWPSTNLVHTDDVPTCFECTRKDP